MTTIWKEAKKQQTRSILMGHLVKASFEELSSTPPAFQRPAKIRASAYLEYYFIQVAAGKGFGQGPPGHEIEFNRRAMVAMDQVLAASREAYKIADYRLTFLLKGLKKEQGVLEAPSWAPERLKQQMKSLGPQIRTVSLLCVTMLQVLWLLSY